MTEIRSEIWIELFSPNLVLAEGLFDIYNKMSVIFKLHTAYIGNIP